MLKKIFFIESNFEKRAFGLDMIRAVAIILVLIAHSIFLLYPLSAIVKYKILHFFAFPAVELFFVLSGFLIGNILIKIFEETYFSIKDIKVFWLRRWFRTLPNYIFILLLNYLLFYLINKEFYPNWRFFLFLQNLASPHPFFFNEAWSLAIEEWFYLFTPVLLFIFHKLLKPFGIRKQKIILSVVLFVIIFGICIRSYSVVFINAVIPWDEGIKKVVINRLDAIMYGVLIAYSLKKNKVFWKKNSFLGFILGLALLTLSMYLLYFYIIVDYANNYIIDISIFTIFNIGTALLIPYSTIFNAPNKILQYFITHVSIISYSVYLIHNSLIFIIQDAIYKPENWFQVIIGFLFFWIITLAISTILYKFFEKPITDLREKFT